MAIAFDPYAALSDAAAVAQAAALLALGVVAGFIDHVRNMSQLDWLSVALGFALAMIIMRLDEALAELRKIRATIERLGARR